MYVEQRLPTQRLRLAIATWCSRIWGLQHMQYNVANVCSLGSCCVINHPTHKELLTWLVHAQSMTMLRLFSMHVIQFCSSDAAYGVKLAAEGSLSLFIVMATSFDTSAYMCRPSGSCSSVWWRSSDMPWPKWMLGVSRCAQ
jgi:hypothetical protein